MRRKAFIFFWLLMFYPLAASAANYDVSFSIAFGDRKSNAHVLGIKREYNPWLKRGNFTIVPSLGLTAFNWHPERGSDVWGTTLAGGISFNINAAKSTTYLFFSSGPTYISDRYISGRDLGSQFHFASTAAVGFKFGSNLRHALEGFFTHYSHAKLKGVQNPGYNIYGLTYRLAF